MNPVSFAADTIPWRLRILLQRRAAKARVSAFANTWPIDDRAGATPPNWPGWPEGKRFALALSHSVKGIKGLQRVRNLMLLESKQHFRSSFYFVPEDKYTLTYDLIQTITNAGFEIGVQSPDHLRRLHNSSAQFPDKAVLIRKYINYWKSSGFRLPLMQHRPTWLHQLGVEYDCSTLDVDLLTSRPYSVRTTFPFWVPAKSGQGYVELPHTVAEDFTLFVILQEPTIAIWKKKLDWIAARGGMVFLNTHTDYIAFDRSPGWAEYSADLYEEFLTYINRSYAGSFWHALPREIARYYLSKLPEPERNTRRRIAMVTHSVYESDNRVRRYAETLVKRGDEVEAFALAGSGGLKTETIQGVTVQAVQLRKRNERRKWQYASQLIRFLLIAMVRIGGRHYKARFDLIHVHNIPDFLVFSAVYPHMTGARVILDIHDLVPELFQDKFSSGMKGLYTRLLLAIEKASAMFADHVIVANHLWQERVIARSARKEKCSVVLNHVDLALFFRRPRTRNDARVIIIFPGSFQRHQGLDIAIRAFARVKKKVQNAEFHLYGGSPGAQVQSELTQLVEALDLKDSVCFYGYVSLDRVPGIIANADLGVVPKRATLFGNEAYSTKIMEFMSQGIPVVATRTRIDTLYFDDSTVRFFSSGDDEDMAEAIMDILQHKAKREMLITNGLDYVARNNWATKKKEYLDIVDTLLSERS